MNTRKILLVDDDQDDCDFLQEAIKSLTKEDIFEYAENGERAIWQLNDDFQKGFVPGLVVMDLNMPRMSGSQTLRKMKSDDRFRYIPVIIYSTSFNPIEQEKCKLLGAHSYLTKPMSFKQCVEIAKIFLDLVN